MTVQNALNRQLSKVDPKQLREIHSLINRHFKSRGTSAEKINEITGIKSDSSTEGRVGLVVRT